MGCHWDTIHLILLYLTQTDAFPTSESKVQKEASPWKCARALSPSEEVTYILFQEKNYSLVSSGPWRLLLC